MTFRKLPTALLTPRLDRDKSSKLPQLLEVYLNQENTKLSDELFQCIAFYLSRLETRLYKKSTLRSEKEYDRRLERVIMFVKFAKENKHRETVYTVRTYSILFPYAEMLLKLKHAKIKYTIKSSLTQTLRCPELKFLRSLYTTRYRR
jgi:hydrogenase maturation factor HypF (carbamoyltransferase family)